MDRVAVFIDAGYLFAQGSVLLGGKKLPRGEIALDHLAAIQALAQFGEKVSGAQLLRVYWYDGTSTGPTPQHLTLAHLDNVKVRLGFVNSVGEQKGVDSLIVTDMIALARNQAISDAVLLSGDEDLRVGVQQAQEFGVRVHLVGIKPSRGTQSLFLLQEADTTHEWAEADLPFLTCKQKIIFAATPITLVTPGTVVPTDPLVLVASKVAGQLQGSEVVAVIDAFEGAGQLPRDIDGKLLAGGRTAIGRDLDSVEKKRIRTNFIESCRKRLAT